MRLKGKRIVLRPMVKKDEKRIAELANDKTISEFTHVPYPYDLAKAREFIKKSNERMKKKEEYHFAITLNDDFIGTIGIIDIVKRDNYGETGYWLGKPYRGQGYVSEACKLILDFSFKKLKFHKMVIMCAKENKGSKKIIDKMGAKFGGVLRAHGFVGGKYKDMLYYDILKKEWKPSKIKLK